MTTDTIYTVELSNTCSCEDEEGNYVSDCWGFCWDDALDEANNLIRTWLERNNTNETSNVHIQGRNMTWLRSDGWIVVQPERVIEAIKLNADFRIVFTLNGTDLSAVRYSHDEPTGASFTLSPTTEEVYE